MFETLIRLFDIHKAKGPLYLYLTPVTASQKYRLFSNLIRTSFCRFLKRKKKVSSRF